MILNTWLHDTCWWNTSFFDCVTKQTFSFLHFLAFFQVHVPRTCTQGPCYGTEGMR